MALISADEDFVVRSLACFASIMEKLFYIASLKRYDGSYDHWGLEYTFGPEASNAAIARAHKDVFLQLLETPLPHLASRGETPHNSLLDLSPADLGGGSLEHLEYVVEVLRLLHVRQVRPTHRAA